MEEVLVAPVTDYSQPPQYVPLSVDATAPIGSIYVPMASELTGSGSANVASSAPLWRGGDSPRPNTYVSFLQDDEPVRLNSNNVGFSSRVILPNELVFVRELEEGGFGKVSQCEWKRPSGENKFVAVKQLKLNQAEVNDVVNFRREIAVHEKLDSPFVVRLYGITEANGVPTGIVMEFLPQGSLRQMFRGIPDPRNLDWNIRRWIAKGIASGLVYLHSQRIVHGDITSSNILRDGQNGVKLADFGLSSVKSAFDSRYYVGGEHPSRPKGALLWLAKELLMSSTAKRTMATDMHSVGVVLWELASHKLPYLGAHGNTGVITTWIKDGTREEFDERTPNTPPKYIEITYDCWNANYSRRPSAKEVLERLENVRLPGEVSPEYYRKILSDCIDAKSLGKNAKFTFRELVENLDSEIKSFPKDWELWEIRGAAKRWLNDYEGAIRDCSEAVRLNSGSAYAYRQRGFAKFELKDFEGAILDFTKAIDRDPSVAWVWWKRGSAKNQLARYDEAIPDCLQSAKLAPRDGDPWLTLGFAYRMSDRPADAVTAYDKVTELDPTNYWGWAQRGSAKRMQGFNKSAIEDFNVAIDIDANIAFAFVNRGDSKRLMKLYDASLPDFGEAIRLDPRFAWAYECRADSYYELGRYDDAARDIKKCLELQPDNNRATGLSEKINRKLREVRKAAASVEYRPAPNVHFHTPAPPVVQPRPSAPPPEPAPVVQPKPSAPPPEDHPVCVPPPVNSRGNNNGGKNCRVM